MIPNSRTFILTIPRNKGRLQGTLQHLLGHGITPTVFEGMDGDICGLETRWEFDHKSEQDTPQQIAQWVAMHFSHYVLWKVCAYQPNDVFVILEDDVRLDGDWRECLNGAMSNIDPDWDLLHIGSCCMEGRTGKQVAARLWRVKSAWCTHAYAVRKKALAVLLDKCQRVHTKVDIAMAEDAMPHLNCFAILPTCARQEGTELHP